jgi:hypothetical protein
MTPKTLQTVDRPKYIRRKWLCAGVLMAAAGTLSAQANSVTPSHYLLHNLVSDLAKTADHQDPNLVNPWGVGFGATPFWVGNYGKGTATLYDGTGAAIQKVIPRRATPALRARSQE